METISQNKSRKRMAEATAGKPDPLKINKPEKPVRGKSLEQIRQDALRELREMGLFF